MGVDFSAALARMMAGEPFRRMAWPEGRWCSYEVETKRYCHHTNGDMLPGSQAKTALFSFEDENASDWVAVLGDRHRGGIVSISRADLAKMLGLPKGVTVEGVEWDFLRGGVSLHLSGPGLPIVREGDLRPVLTDCLWLHEDGRVEIRFTDYGIVA